MKTCISTSSHSDHQVVMYGFWQQMNRNRYTVHSPCIIKQCCRLVNGYQLFDNNNSKKEEKVDTKQSIIVNILVKLAMQLYI